jgi:predicted Rossmann fold flavoprotein
MDASRWWTSARERGDQAEFFANLRPGWTMESATRWFIAETAAGPRRSLGRTLTLVLPERLAEALCAFAGADARLAAGQVTRAQRERLLSLLIRLPLRVTADRGWNYAEVTAGGIPLEEIDYRTMESRLARGLYLIGEILDCDGRIGGFNFQWAWATGYIAGSAAADVRS